MQAWHEKVLAPCCDRATAQSAGRKHSGCTVTPQLAHESSRSGLAHSPHTWQRGQPRRDKDFEELAAALEERGFSRHGGGDNNTSSSTLATFRTCGSEPALGSCASIRFPPRKEQVKSSKGKDFIDTCRVLTD
jgi:hypothetical protein